MTNTPAIYLDKVVSKENFRVFIYSVDGSQKLVNSWDEFQKEMAGGLWFAIKPEPVIKRNKKNVTQKEVTQKED